MFEKKCPWCDETPTFNQLGRRPVQKRPKWYQFSRTVNVCPYCAGAVKLGGNAIWFMILVIPTFLSYLTEIFIGFDLLGYLGATDAGLILLLLGCTATFIFSVFKKVENEEKV